MKWKKAVSGIVIGGMILSNGMIAFANEGLEPKMILGETVVEQVDEGQVIKLIEPIEEKMYFDDFYHEVDMSEANLSEEQAKKIMYGYIKEFFDIEINEYTENMEVYVEYRPHWETNKYVWSMWMHRYSRNSSLSIAVEIDDETSNLISINKHEYTSQQQNMIVRYTKEEAQEIADAFLRKVNSQLYNELQLDARQPYPYDFHHMNTTGLRPSEYPFFYARTKDNIPVVNEGVRIFVNNATGEITSYHYNWTDEEIPNIEPQISIEDVKNVLSENAKVQLYYVPVRDNKSHYDAQVNEVKIAYIREFDQGAFVDAVTGKLLNYYGAMIEELERKDITPEQREAFLKLEGRKVTRSENMKKEEAVNLANEILKEFYGDAKIDRVSYSSGRNYGHPSSEGIWNISFIMEEQSDIRGQITLDARTEQIINLSYWGWNEKPYAVEENEEPLLTWEQSYEKAIETIKRLYPERLKSLETAQTIYAMDDKFPHYRQDYFFNFQRNENGILYGENFISIGIDATTGLLRELYTRWDNVELPKVEGLISEEQAVEIFLGEWNIEPFYVRMPQFGEEQAEGEFKLAYINSPKTSIYYTIDAKTGKYLDWSGQEVKDVKERSQEIVDSLKGHWAEKQLRIMYDNGVLDLDNYKLTDIITRNQLVEIMVNALGLPYYLLEESADLKFTNVHKQNRMYSYLQAGVLYGFIENEIVEFKGEEPVTREELAKMLILMADLKKIAEIKEIYNIPVKDMDDIDPELMGYVALTYGLGILRGSNGYYQPKSEVNVEQAAATIYRTLDQFPTHLKY